MSVPAYLGIETDTRATDGHQTGTTLRTDAHLARLNDEQRAAATTRAAAALVLAGPGSGKTKTLVARIVDLVVDGISPSTLLAVTFSRRATAELRHRLSSELDETHANAVRISTLHAYALGLVRTHAQLLGLSDRLTVADPDDVLRHLRRWVATQPPAVQAGGVDAITTYITTIRQARFERALLADPGTAWATYTHRVDEDGIYSAYLDLLQDDQVIDLDLVVPAAALLLRDHPTLCASVSETLTHILIDEFQDTSLDQWELLSALAPHGGPVALFAVGDDAQSIYGWRGATLENMERLAYGYPGCERFTLDRNYRSTARIVRAANEVLPHTGSRFPRVLWTDREAPTAIQVVSASTAHEEATYVVQRILELKARDAITRFRDVLVLYRTNAMSGALEEAFREARVPYRLSTGRRFFERPEIRGVIGLLQAATNPTDRGAAERALTGVFPRPSDAAIRAALAAADQQQCPVWDLLARGDRMEGVKPTQAARLAVALPLLRLINAAATPAEAIQSVVRETSLRQRLLEALPTADPTLHNMPEREFWQWFNDAERRLDAVDSLLRLGERFTAAAQYEHWLDGPPRDVPLTMWRSAVPLSTFLDDIATLLDDTDLLIADTADAVSCMTVHAAKGIEAPAVFVVGMNEGEFPVLSKVHIPERKTPEWVAHAEEARVFFVAITRAQTYLHLTSTRAPSHRARRAGGAGSTSRYLSWLPDMTYVLQDRA